MVGDSDGGGWKECNKTSRTLAQALMGEDTALKE